jgi:hypothetical protein
MRTLVRRPAIALMMCFVALGCAQETEIVAAQPAIPATPDGTVMAVAQNLADNHPEILWEALPASYRADITELTQLFAAKMDPEIYDRAMDARMTQTLQIAKTFFSSEVSTVAGLAVIDWQQFLAGTVSRLMAQADAIEAEEGKDPFLMFESLQVEVLEQTDASARLRITVPDEEPEEVALVLIEERWVPVEMAEQWDAKVMEARTGLEEITPEKMQELKGQAMFGFAMAEGLVQQLSTIETSEEFDATMGPMIDGFMQNISGFIPQMDETVDPEPETP